MVYMLTLGGMYIDGIHVTIYIYIAYMDPSWVMIEWEIVSSSLWLTNSHEPMIKMMWWLTKFSNQRTACHTPKLGLTTKFLAPFAKVVCIYIHLHERMFDVQAYIRTPLTSWAVKGSTIKLIKDNCRILGTNQTVSAHTNTISLLSAGSHSQPFGVCEGPKEAS